ncbi:MAG: DNA gyrase subunit A, partial [Treponema sp.]|nr:DNA gyrase subunit A [Treponema sp.]
SSKTSRGSHIKSLLQVTANEEITTLVGTKEMSDELYLFMATAAGVVKKTATSEFRNAKTKGMQAVRLDEGDSLVSGILTTGKQELLLVSRRGQALRISEEEVRAMGRASRGVAGMKLSEGDELCAAIPVEEGSKILVVTERGTGKRVEFSEFSPHGRGTGGQRVFGNVDGKGEIIGALTVADSDSVMCITSQGTSLRVKVSDISVQGRASSGVKVVDVSEPDYVVAIDKVASDDESENS